MKRLLASRIASLVAVAMIGCASTDDPVAVFPDATVDDVAIETSDTTVDTSVTTDAASAGTGAS